MKVPAVIYFDAMTLELCFYPEQVAQDGYGPANMRRVRVSAYALKYLKNRGFTDQVEKVERLAMEATTAWYELMEALSKADPMIVADELAGHLVEGPDV